MDSLKKSRTIARSHFTKAKNTCENKLNTTPLDILEVKIAYEYLSEKAEKLFKLDDAICELLLASDLSAEGIEEEEASTECYRLDWLRVKNKYETNTLLNPAPSEARYDNASIVTNTMKRKFRLPTLELVKFDGMAKNWLPFWGMFRKIHDDENIDLDDKFQYLVQSMEPGSSARMLVDSFPSSGNNYEQALEQLKSRYARDEILIEIYVRELLALVLEQAKGRAMSLTILYDRLRTQLRALESLGVTSDKYACMLYPLVESVLPTELLRVWERSRKESNDQSDALSQLLKFLKTEVESEELIEISRKSLLIKEDHVPTAAYLVDSERKTKVSSCIWCDQTSHGSLECYKPQRLSLKARTDILKDKKACLLCLRPGHNIRRCKNKTKCFICAKRHAPLICPETNKLQQKSQDETEDNEPNTSKSALSTSLNFQSARIENIDRTTVLQTLMVKINGENVRAFIDTGAQRSYIRTDIAGRLKLARIGTETLTHNLFGGVETKKQKHSVYNFVVKSTTEEFALLMIALDKVNICSYIPRIRNTAPIVDEIQLRNIKLSDMGDENTPIGLLIGADYSGLIMTDQIVSLSNGVVALKTKLGWTIQGQMMSKYTVCSSWIMAHTVSDIGHLWDLEIIGIRDPVEIKSKEQRQAEVMHKFIERVTVNEEKRYEVALPWKEGHLELDSNKVLAKRRLISTTKRLEALQEFNNYQEVFREWLELGIIEKDIEENKPGHYLPHHAVIKNSSLTTRVRPVFDASAKGANGISLNDSLEKGENLLELIPILITRFRMHAIGITADIKKAFLQISVREEDRAYLRFLWWEGEDKRNIITYKHCRVVFGLTCSPFLLAATIIYHLDRSSRKYQKTAQLLKSSFYVDNCILSLDSKMEAEQFINEAKLLMTEGNFDLRAWITAPIRSTRMHGVINTTTVLGLDWDIAAKSMKRRSEAN